MIFAVNQTGYLSVVSGQPMSFSYSGDGGDALSATLNFPWGLVYDHTRNRLYIGGLLSFF
jgi:hypothetical protein